MLRQYLKHNEMSNYKICVVKLKSNAALANIRPVKPPKTKHEINVLTITNDQSLKIYFC